MTKKKLVKITGPYSPKYEEPEPASRATDWLVYGINGAQVCRGCGEKIPKGTPRLRKEFYAYRHNESFTLCPTCIKEIAKAIKPKELKEWKQTLFARKLTE